MKTTLENTVSEYDQQAETFLASNGLKFRATLSDTKTPAWADGGKFGHHYRVTLSRAKGKECRSDRLAFDFWNSIADCECRECKGKKVVRLEKPEPIHVPHPKSGQKFNMGTERRPVMYDYPSTLAAWKRDTQCPRCKGSGVDPEPIHPSAYDVLACISSDAYCAETFKDFCGEYGYERDSIKALQTFRRCSAFAKRLRAFFTAEELSQLSEIN